MDNEYHTKFDDVLTEVDAAKADAAKTAERTFKADMLFEFHALAALLVGTD